MQAEKLNLAAKKVSNTLSSFGKSMLQRMQRSTDATTSAGPMDTRGASSDGNMPHGGTSASTLGAGGSDQVGLYAGMILTGALKFWPDQYKQTTGTVVATVTG